MGRALYDTEPVFRAQIDKAAALLAPVVPRPLLEVLFATEGNEISQTAYSQPALFALEYALAELWRSWGITPAIVMGHSVGEYVAACVAGVFSFEEGLALIAERARLMQALPAGGGMAALLADEKRALDLIAPYPSLSIAAVNSPDQTVVAGDSSALAQLLDSCAAAGIKGKALDVSHAFHSQLLDPMLDALERRAAGVPHTAPRIALVSNLTGKPFAAGTHPDARYWRQHARQPVRFADSLEALRAAGATAVVEIGPHPILLALVARAMPSATWLTAASMRRGRDDRREMLSSLASLYVRGAPVKWDAVVAGHGGRRIPLPTYPFQRERYWVERPRGTGATARGATMHGATAYGATGHGATAHGATTQGAPAYGVTSYGAASGHPLLGEGHTLAAVANTHIWQQDISLETHPWLGDHRVQGAAIVPATAYIEMALAAAGEVLGSGSLVVREIQNLKPIILHEGIAHRVQASLVMESDGSARFTVHGHRLAAKASAPISWTQHMTARLAPTETTESADTLATFEAIKRASDDELSGDRFYSLLANKGNQWGPAFQGMRQVWRHPGEALGRIDIPASLAGEITRYRFHPAVSDSCGHALVATLPLEAATGPRGGAFVGGGVGEIRFHRPVTGSTLWARAKLRERTDDDGNVVIGDVWVYDETGALVSETREARLWYLDDKSRSEMLGAPPDWFYEVRWQRQELAAGDGRSPQAQGVPSQAESRRSPAAGPWIILADRGGLAESIAAARAAQGLETVLVAQGDEWQADGNRYTMRAGQADDYRRLLAAVPKPAAILHLWSRTAGALGAAGVGGIGTESVGGVGAAGVGGIGTESVGGIRAASAGGTGTDTSGASGVDTSADTTPAESVLHLLHAIRAAGTTVRPRLWLLTSGATAVTVQDRVEAPWNATLWGLGKSLSVEHAEIWGGCIDLPVAEPSAAPSSEELARAVLREVESATPEDEVAFRDGHRFVARLERRQQSTARHDFATRPQATYVITGGLGGIGLAMAHWLAEQGARHLLLLGRTALPPRGQWDQIQPQTPVGRRITAINAIEALGAQVQTSAVDVSDDTALRQCLEGRRSAGLPEVRGVIHAAGILKFEALEAQTPQSLRELLAAKVQGAWVLHHVLQEQPLDFFVLCSSTSALLSSPLLGGYAAGNAFLDALAHHRKAAGLPALSVNWGTWGEVGMAVEAGRSASGAMLTGVATIPTATGLAALRELLETDATQAAVMPIDWAALVRAYPAFAADTFLQSQVAAIQHSHTGGEQDDRSFARTLAEAADPESRALALRAYLHTEAARVLGFVPSKLDPEAPLSSFGFDSLMAVQLKNRIEADLGLVIPMIQFLQGPSVEQLIPVLLEAAGSTVPGAGPIATGDVAEEMWEVGSL